MTDKQKPDACALCGRDEIELTKHHLIPRTRHKNRKNKRDFSREEVRQRIIWICRPCHNNVHSEITEKDLERNYNTLEALQAHPRIQTFSVWIANKPSSLKIPRPRQNRRK